jgi:hypothetical protein
MLLLQLAAAAALSVTVSANVKTYNFNSTCDEALPRARVINRCSYPVYAWSVDSDDSSNDCGFQTPAIIEPGGIYQENYRKVAIGGVSIKLSKDEDCKSQGSITQLEYRIEDNSEGHKYDFNSLDVSYVDCTKGDCPTRQEGYHLISGNHDGKFATAGVDSAICPIISCSSEAECAPHSYIKWDDLATKTCDNSANLDFYMCGGEAPGKEVKPQPSKGYTEEKPKPSKVPAYKEPTPSSKEAPAPVITAPAYVVDDIAGAGSTIQPQQVNENKVDVKTVYETVYATTTIQPHGYRHRRHQRIHA